MKLLLSLVLACAVMLGAASATEFKDTWYWHMEGRVDVFWHYIKCDGEYVDLDVPPPNYDPEQDRNLSRRSEIGYESAWREYFYNEDPILTWHGMRVRIQDELSTYLGAVKQDKIDAWSMYLNEMYYEGGPVWEDKLMKEFWGNLTFNGKRVNVYAPPPNYNPDLDYWSFMRDEIGYAWYWEYYIASQMSLIDENPTNLKWKGIAFSTHYLPPKYDKDEYNSDPFDLNRLRRGQLDRWAEYFVYEYSDKK